MRRRAILAAALAAPGIAQAQSQGTMRIVVPYPPGGGADLLARALAAWIGTKHGRTVVVENRPGASGTIGAAYLARLPADGETVMQADAAGMVIQPLVNRLPYGFDDFAPVARLVTNVVVVAASPESGIRNVAGLVARARARSGALTYATPGLLSHLHVAMEAFAGAAGMEMVHVPFQGTAPGVTAALAGQGDPISPPPRALAARAGDRRLRPGAGMAADLVFNGWRGFFAPRGTPRAATAIWERAAFEAPQDPAFAQRLVSLGERASPLGPDDFARFWAAEIAALRALLPRLPRG